MGELSCRELVELVTDYLEDRLAPADRARFDEHLAVCEGCERHLAQMHVTLRLARADRRPAPADVEPLLAAFRSWHARAAR